MKTLIIKIEVDNDLDAYKAVSRLGFMFNVLEAEYDSKKYQFSKEEEKSFKNFLKKETEINIKNV